MTSTQAAATAQQAVVDADQAEQQAIAARAETGRLVQARKSSDPNPNPNPNPKPNPNPNPNPNPKPNANANPDLNPNLNPIQEREASAARNAPLQQARAAAEQVAAQHGAAAAEATQVTLTL